MSVKLRCCSLGQLVLPRSLLLRSHVEEQQSGLVPEVDANHDCQVFLHDLPKVLFQHPQLSRYKDLPRSHVLYAALGHYGQRLLEL